MAGAFGGGGGGGARGGGTSLTCPDCQQGSYKDETSLQNHIKKQHRRPFSCVFDFAGCDSTFPSKNEWKRHVMSQHISLHYWLCTEGPCADAVASHGHYSSAQSTASSVGSPSRGSSNTKGDVGAPGRAAASGTGKKTTSALAPSPGSHAEKGVIFNRKDLFTQHLRRMHAPPGVEKGGRHHPHQPSAKGSSAGAAQLPPGERAWQGRIRELQESSVRQRCALPDRMACPAAGCGKQFRGAQAWDQRMEHVARHVEAAATGKEPAVVFGGSGDATLMDWATKPEVGILCAVGGVAGQARWELANPLRRGGQGGGGGGRGAVMKIKDEIVVEGMGDEDAEGEDDF